MPAELMTQRPRKSPRLVRTPMIAPTGIYNNVPTLSPEEAADLIALDFGVLESQPLYDPVSHLVYCTTRNQITHTWVNGRLLLDNRQLTTLDEAALIANAQAWQAKIGETP